MVERANSHGLLSHLHRHECADTTHTHHEVNVLKCIVCIGEMKGKEETSREGTGVRVIGRQHMFVW